MGEDHVRALAAGRGDSIADEAKVLTARRLPMIDGNQLDFVAESLELAPDGDEEAAEVRIVGPGPHLGQELDPHDRG